MKDNDLAFKVISLYILLLNNFLTKCMNELIKRVLLIVRALLTILLEIVCGVMI